MAPPTNPDPSNHTDDPGPIALTTAEIRRLFNALLGAVHTLAHRLPWSS